MIALSIISVLAVAACIYLFLENRKCKEQLSKHQQLYKADAGNYEKRIVELSARADASELEANRLKDRIETLTAEADSLKAERQQNAALSNSLQSSVSELKQKIDAQKLKMVDILKHLQPLQRTIMTDAGQVKSMFSDFFVLYKPWETVGGDFYKFIRKGDYTLVACGNCGQSGIGGFVKGILNIVFLQEIVDRNDLSKMEAGQVLDSLRSKYAHLAEKSEQYNTDEDIPVNFSVCIINEKQRMLSYAGAYGSVCLIRKSYPGTSRKENDLHEFRGDRMNFAVSFGRRKNYTTEFIELEKDDRIYLKTDGFVNQRGGQQNARFGDNYLRQLMMKHANEPMIEQKRAYEEEFNAWRGDANRGNDILIIGLALKVAGK